MFGRGDLTERFMQIRVEGFPFGCDRLSSVVNSCFSQSGSIGGGRVELDAQAHDGELVNHVKAIYEPFTAKEISDRTQC